MAKCRIIDRLAYTKGEIKFLDDETEKTHEPHKQPQPEQHGDICPKCGQRTLHHIEGCETCASCGYSKCSIAW